MIRSELNALVLSWLDDEGQGYFNASDVNRWLNLATQKVQMRLLQAGNNWYMRPVETLTVSGQADYVLPIDFMVDHRIELVLSGTGTNEVRRPLAAMTTNQQDKVPIALGTPYAYYIKKDRITISPTPQQQWVMRLYYSPLVPVMTLDSDSPDVPEQFMEMVALQAAYDGFIKDDRAPANLAAKMQWYDEMLKQMAIERTQDAPRTVVQVDDYDTGYGVGQGY